ncbi:50S ribosomal protein L29 [Methanotorris igneus]|uniref:Large ribosomal subunit protein uL29 n=1 Tax=Methanotorris igneus (strain DSM 5666 / JCM 11834 / Kol 5) TaxID=880724 RepID=F6BD94_METIK|nr:50S ribosomal protein L29 [Methanotorris igneus]AEF96455.1 ribosomal protein L29 [Methanotorris igneus Kol 5]
MAILRASEIREMSIEEMKEKLVELKKELLKENVHKAVSGAPSNPGRVKELKRTIARILTIMNEKKRQIA